MTDILFVHSQSRRNGGHGTRNTTRRCSLQRAEDGFFFIVGRKKEMIIASGYNVYPIEVENTIYKHPAVLEVAVIGIPHEYRGETISAVVVLKEGHDVTAEQLIDFCRSELSAYKVPKEIQFVNELPKTAVGKILKKNLKQQLNPKSEQV